MNDNKLFNKKCIICDKFHQQTNDSEDRICSDCHNGFDCFQGNIMTFKRAILYLKCTSEPGILDSIVHGVDCPKAKHNMVNQSHEAADDAAFNPGSATYCGRCHCQM